jgi:DNA polymerase-3 subunit alpha
MAAIDGACEHGARHQRDRDEGQAQLFGAIGDPEGHHAVAGGPVALPDAAPWTEADQLAFEKETLGLYWSGHPVDRYAAELKAFGARATNELAEAPLAAPSGDSWGPNGRKPLEADTAVGGIIAAVRQLKTKKGDRMAVFTLEDAHGTVEVIAFPEAFQRAATLIETGRMVLVRGKLERDDETARILGIEIVPIESVRERLAREVSIVLKRPADRQTFEALGEIFSRHRGDRRVSFEIELPRPANGGGAPGSDARDKRLVVKADVSSQIRVRPSPALVAEVEQVVGQGAVSFR